MMTNPTLTQIARGSYEAQPDADRLSPWEKLAPYQIEREITRTRAAVQALIANISEEMVEAGRKVVTTRMDCDRAALARDHVSGTFTAMLQSLLKGDEA